MSAHVDPTAPAPRPHIWMTSLKFLLRHGHRTGELIAALAMAGRTEVEKAVLFSLEHVPGAVTRSSSMIRTLDSPVDHLLERFRVSLSLHGDPRRGLFDFPQVGGSQFEGDRPDVLLQPVQFCRPRDGGEPRLPGE